MGHLTEIARFFDPEEAYCAKSFLESEGVPVLLQNEHHLSVDPTLRIALKGYGLFTLHEHVEEAKETLNIINAQKVEKIKERKQQEWLWLPVAFLMGTPFLPLSKTGFLALFQNVVMLLFYYIVAMLAFMH